MGLRTGASKLRLTLGLGDLFVDHLFIREGLGGLRYAGSRGGGTASNVVANVAHSGAPAAFVGVAGDDVWGQRARDELTMLGASTGGVQLLPRRLTRAIFHIVTASRDQRQGGVSHVFRISCAICGRTQPSTRLARATQSHLERVGTMRASCVVVDTLARDRVAAAADLRSRGSFAILDVGRLAYLRRVPVTSLVHPLRAFDVLFAPADVVRSLATRLDVSEKHLAELGPQLAVVASDGDRGLTLVPAGRLVSRHLPPPQNVAVRDSTGAGDALIGSLAEQLSRSPQRAPSIRHFESMLRRGLATLPAVLAEIGARGHLPKPPGPDPLEQFVGKSAEAITAATSDMSSCPFCLTRAEGVLAPPVRRRSPPGARGNLALLERRAFFAAERAAPVARCRAFIDGARGSVFVVGTGGSYPVAVFISDLLNAESGVFAQPIRPLDFVRLAKPADHLVAVSYSGRTADCGDAIKVAHRVGVPHVALVTAALRPRLGTLLRRDSDELISYGGRGQRLERGFVSIAGTVAPCAVWTAAAEGRGQFASLARSLRLRADESDALIEAVAEVAADGGGLLVLGGGRAWPAMWDVESKFVEANLGPAVLHESKDFSHGRFMSVLSRDATPPKAALLLTVGPPLEYEQALAEALATRLDVHVLSSQHVGTLGALELVIRVQEIVQRIGQRMRRDISRPSHVPSAGLRLYRWVSLTD